MPPVTHILLDYENVQPSEEELRTLVPAVTKLWVFHGPHQKQVELRFVSFGPDVTAVPISRTGRNALDFHLSFYMGYIVSRDQRAKIVVVANDKGYDPMLEHAKELGFSVDKIGHRAVAATEVAVPQPKAMVAAKPATKNEAKKSAKKETMATKTKATAKRVAAKTVVAQQIPAKNLPAPTKKNAPKVQAPKASEAENMALTCQGAVPPAVIERIVEGLQKMRDKRPVKMTSLRRALKPLLGTAASEETINVALNRLIPMGIVNVGSSGELSYPKFSR